MKEPVELLGVGIAGETRAVAPEEEAEEEEEVTEIETTGESVMARLPVPVIESLLRTCPVEFLGKT